MLEAGLNVNRLCSGHSGDLQPSTQTRVIAKKTRAAETYVNMSGTFLLDLRRRRRVEGCGVVRT